MREHLRRKRRTDKKLRARNKTHERQIALMKALDQYFNSLIQPIRLDVFKILSEAVRAVIAKKEGKCHASTAQN